MWLHTVTSRNDTVLQKAASYKAGLNVEPEETELDNVAESLSTIVTTQPQDSHEADARSKVSRYSSRHHKSGSHKSSRYTVAQSKTSTEKRRDLLVLKKQQEELERQAKVSLKLKAQQNEIKEQQGNLELEELVEVHRKKLAEIELKEFELEEELSAASEKIVNASVTHVDPQRTEQWVENVVTEQEQAEVVASSEQSHPVVESSTLIASDVLQGVASSSNFLTPHLASTPHAEVSQNHNLIPQASGSIPASMPFGNPTINVAPPSVSTVTNPVSLPASQPFVPPLTVPIPISLPIIQPFVPSTVPIPSLLPLSQPHSGPVSTGYQAPAAPSHQPINVPNNLTSFSSEHYNPYSSLRRPAATAQTMPVPQYCAPPSNVFSVTTPVVPPNTVVPYTSFGTVYYTQPQTHPVVETAHQGYPPTYPAPTTGPSYVPNSEQPISARELADIILHSRKDRLPELNLEVFDGEPLNWYEWFGQFQATVDSAMLTDDEKLKYLKTHVKDKAKSTIAEYGYSGVLYKDALATLQRKFGQPHVVVGAHLDKLKNFSALKMHNSDHVISFSAVISGLVAVFRSLSFNDDLKSVNLLNQAVSKLPPNLKEAWSIHTVRQHWQRLTLLDFNDWLENKAEGHERLKSLVKVEQPVKQKVVTKVLAGNTKVSSKDEKSREKTRFPPCSLCKVQHALWNCSVFKEKNATQRAKYVAEQKLCFSCLKGNHTFRKCQKARKCPKQDCESTHNVLLHGAEKVFPPKEADRSPSTQTNTNTTSANNAACVKPCEGTAKVILPVALVDVSSGSENYPQLAPLKTTAYNYKEIEIVIGQDFYHAIRPLEHVFGDELDSPCAVRLPIGWVISGPSPDRSSLNSSSFNCVTDDISLTDQIKTWYELESYGAFKQVDARSAADKRALSILKTETVHDGERYTVPMLWSDNDVSLPNNYYSSLAQLKSLEKRLDRDPLLREKYTETIREDISKGYVITVNPHDPSSRAEREWYLPHHPVLNPNKPGKVRRVLNGASKFHGTSLNRSLLVGPDLLQNLIFVLLRFRQHK